MESDFASKSASKPDCPSFKGLIKASKVAAEGGNFNATNAISAPVLSEPRARARSAVIIN